MFAEASAGRLKMSYWRTIWVFQILFSARMAEPEHG